MKNKIISIILLFVSLSITGCGTEQASVEPTESVIETETEEVAVATESITDSTIIEDTGDVGGSGDSTSAFSNSDDIYSDEVIGTLAMYDFFEGSTADEIRQFVKDHDDIQEILNTHDSEYIDSWIPEFKDFYGGTLYELNHPATNNSSTSNKGNSSSTNNTAGGQSNTSNSNTGSNSSTPAEQPPAPSNSESSGVPSTDDIANLNIPGWDTDGSKFGNEGHTDYNNTIQ